MITLNIYFITDYLTNILLEIKPHQCKYKIRYEITLFQQRTFKVGQTTDFNKTPFEYFVTITLKTMKEVAFM